MEEEMWAGEKREQRRIWLTCSTNVKFYYKGLMGNVMGNENADGNENVGVVTLICGCYNFWVVRFIG